MLQIGDVPCLQGKSKKGETRRVDGPAFWTKYVADRRRGLFTGEAEERRDWNSAKYVSPIQVHIYTT